MKTPMLILGCMSEEDGEVVVGELLPLFPCVTFYELLQSKLLPFPLKVKCNLPSCFDPT